VCLQSNGGASRGRLCLEVTEARARRPRERKLDERRFCFPGLTARANLCRPSGAELEVGRWYASALRARERRRDGLLRKGRWRRGTISGRRGRSDGGRPGLLTSKRDPSSQKTLLWMTAKNRWMLGRWARRSGSSADPSSQKTLLWMTAQCGWPAWSIALNGFAVCSQGVESLRQLPPFIPFHGLQTVVQLQLWNSLLSSTAPNMRAD
jgi:hypothetical protein